MSREPVVAFRFPEQAKVARRVPKERLYLHGKPGDKLRQAIVQQLDRLVWQYKLAPETINLPASDGLLEIQVFDLHLKEGIAALDGAVLRLLARAIPHPLYCRIHAGDRLQFGMIYSGPGAASDTSKAAAPVFVSPWLPAAQAEATSQPLPVCTSLAALHAALFRSLLPLPPRPGETLQDQLQRLQQRDLLARQLAALQARRNGEKQYNRKVQLNAECRALKAQLQQLD